MNTKPLTTAAFALALAAGLAACSSDATPAPVPSVTASATQAPAAEPSDDATTEAPGVDLPKIGLSDGTWTTMEPGGPIPEAILTDVKAQITAKGTAIEALNLPSNGENTPPTTASTVEASMNAAKQLSKDLSAATGRTVFVVFEGWGGNDAGHYSTWWASSPGGSVAGLKAMESKDDYLAALNAWIAAQPDPSAFEVIVPE